MFILRNLRKGGSKEELEIIKIKLNIGVEGGVIGFADDTATFYTDKDWEKQKDLCDVRLV